MGCQLVPAYGFVWYGPASSSVHTASPSFSPSRYARSINAFFGFGVGVVSQDRTTLALTPRVAGLAPDATALPCESSLAQHRPDREAPDLHALLAQGTP